MRKKILVVEDHTDIRRMMSIALRQYGFDVVEAADGYEAIEKVAAERPDVVLMDLSMPILDGISSTRAIRSREGIGELPIIAITAYDKYDDAMAISAGCNEVLRKPLDFEKLHSIVNQYSGLPVTASLTYSRP
jgi:two-component system cell cycle response regulator DivK